MIVSDLASGELERRLAGAGLRLRTGPVVTNIHSVLPLVSAGLRLHYGQHPVEADAGFADFHVAVVASKGLRRWFRRQVLFQSDESKPFAPLPLDQAFPMLEWGLNWCISNHCHQYLIIHAAVVERHGGAMILPAPPGSGKSTLCAGLVAKGWRLLSDELTLIDMDSGQVVPVPRPVSLKNASIEAIRRFDDGVVIGPAVRDTFKGTVAHMQPPAASVCRAEETARPALIVLPRYSAGAATTLGPLSKANAYMQLADNSFNYHLHGYRGFERLAAVVDGCSCHEFSYSDLGEAVRVFDGIAESWS